MGKRTRYEAGTFCWTDLATTDPEGAKAFYVGLFGWGTEDTPAGEAGTYTMLKVDGDEVCALYGMEPERRALGIPSHWLSHVSVESADAIAARAEELGGETFGGAFDVEGVGRMALVQDPAGAVLAAWEPGAHVGARRVNDVGCMTWNELQSREPEGAATFYSDLFGWETEAHEYEGRVAYVTIRNAGSENGGVMPMTEAHGDAPPHWLPYFTVASCDDAIARARDLGGKALAGPIELPQPGSIAVLQDPQGAAFAVYEGETDD
jgi:predicted enzyme related to lactoylglutathione lyase